MYIGNRILCSMKLWQPSVTYLPNDVRKFFIHFKWQPPFYFDHLPLLCFFSFKFHSNSFFLLVCLTLFVNMVFLCYPILYLLQLLNLGVVVIKKLWLEKMPHLGSFSQMPERLQISNPRKHMFLHKDHEEYFFVHR